MSGARNSDCAHGRGSGERYAMIDWAARLGAITADALAARDQTTLASARARLAAGAGAGLLVRTSPLRNSAALYTATRAGLGAAGVSSLGPCRVSASNAAHLATCASAAAALERCYPDHAVIGERELRRDEQEVGKPLASAVLAAPGARGARLHRPDLVLWPRDRDALPIAVEVELTVKAPRRLQEICRAWARARCVEGVLYVAAPEVEPRLERAIGRAHAGERVVVLPLTALLPTKLPPASRAHERGPGLRTAARTPTSARENRPKARVP